ncbi:MAG: ABC transporter ATP-binding protein [Clostridiales bacterium]|jgi:ABC-2 type transport system ATP-binding protein|nr:ABC transporter ATP-binding protein [Clostridiales bacterium]
MSKQVVLAEDIAVMYPIGNLKNIGLKEYLIRKIKKQYPMTMFTALTDVSFVLNEGDMLGIIGSNGAGKSTLCKIIAEIMYPSKGSITVNGNVAALLELTTGFDAHMTVRENTYLRGAILGYSKQFLDEKYPEIIDFAELRDFQEFAFQQLSSGMKARLAFSIACLIQPEIIILDEVLSVGDGAFKKKSEAKMLEVINSGATTIIVSHSIEQVTRLCNKVLWLDHGRQLAFSGNVAEVCEEYNSPKHKDGRK